MTLKPYRNGLYPAAGCRETGYSRVWIRDNIYTILGIVAEGKIKDAVKTVQALLDIMIKHEEKIDWMIKQPQPKHRWRYIHPRYDEKGNEIWEEWGNKQNDAIGALLWKVGVLSKKTKVIRHENDKRILKKLVKYLEAIEYWKDEDNGIWEENEEIHASSIGACIAGLNAISDIIKTPLHTIAHGEEALKKLLPQESATKTVDLALLSLIYPYNIVNKKTARQILKNVENYLLRERGVIRYEGDKYYYNENDEAEAEWTMGLPWLAICHKILGNKEKYEYYLQKTKQAINEEGQLPELYYGKTNKHNENTPLLWAESLKKVSEKPIEIKIKN